MLKQCTKYYFLCPEKIYIYIYKTNIFGLVTRCSKQKDLHVSEFSS